MKLILEDHQLIVHSSWTTIRDCLSHALLGLHPMKTTDGTRCYVGIFYKESLRGIMVYSYFSELTKIGANHYDVVTYSCTSGRNYKNNDSANEQYVIVEATDGDIRLIELNEFLKKESTLKEKEYECTENK